MERTFLRPFRGIWRTDLDSLPLRSRPQVEDLQGQLRAFIHGIEFQERPPVILQWCARQTALRVMSTNSSSARMQRQFSSEPVPLQALRSGLSIRIRPVISEKMMSQ